MADESLEDFLKNLGKAKDELKKVGKTSVGKVAFKFMEGAIKGAQDTMQKTNRNATTTLSQSLDLQFIAGEGESFTINLLADEYWDYIDAGVDGVNQSAGATENSYGQTYKFNYINPSRSHVDAMSGNGMQNWLAARGVKQLRWQDKESGEMRTKELITDKDYRGAAYVLARGTKRNGIKPNHFISNEFTDDKIKELESELVDAWLNIF